MSGNQTLVPMKVASGGTTADADTLAGCHDDFPGCHGTVHGAGICS